MFASFLFRRVEWLHLTQQCVAHGRISSGYPSEAICRGGKLQCPEHYEEISAGNGLRRGEVAEQQACYKTCAHERLNTIGCK